MSNETYFWGSRYRAAWTVVVQGRLEVADACWTVNPDVGGAGDAWAARVAGELYL